MKRRIKRVRIGQEKDLIPYSRRDGLKGCLQRITRLRRRYKRIPFYTITLACGHEIDRTPHEVQNKTGLRIDCRECKP